jgi:hypothetical protein
MLSHHPQLQVFSSPPILTGNLALPGGSDDVLSLVWGRRKRSTTVCCRNRNIGLKGAKLKSIDQKMSRRPKIAGPSIQQWSWQSKIS